MTAGQEQVDVRLGASAAQRAMWFGEQADAAGAAYNVGEYTEIHGPVDAGRLRAAIGAAVDATEALRSRFVAAGQDVAQLVDGRPEWSMPVVDLSAEADPLDAARAWMAADFAVPFDPAAGPLFRYALLRLAPDHSVWYQCYHHIAIDGFSCSLVAARVAEAYTDAAVPPSSPVAALVAEDAAYRASERYAADRAHWAEVMADAPEPVGLSPVPPRVDGGFRRRTAHLSTAAGEAVHACAEHGGTRWSRVVVAAVAGFLHRLTGAREVVLGLAVTARRSEAALATPGMASNVLPLRLAVRPDATVAELVRETARATRDLLAHQRYRGEELRRELDWSGTAHRFFGPVVNIMAFGPELRFDGCPTTRHNLSTGPVEDLAVNVYDRSDRHGLRVDLDAARGRYPEGELDVLHRRFMSFLEHFAAAGPDTPLGRLDVLLPGEEDAGLLVGDPATAGLLSGDPETVPAVFAARVAERPDAVAVTGEFDLTYRQLDQRAELLAEAVGPGPEERVAVLMRRSPDLIAALLGVLSGGGAYVPLDPRAPDARLRRILAHTGASVLLTDASLAERARTVHTGRVLVVDDLAVSPSAERGDVPLRPDGLACVMYTSGSTGEPKGVAVTHRDLTALAADRRFDGAAHERVLAHSPVAFDASSFELWVPLLRGGSVVVAPEGDVDAAAVARLSAEHGLTALWLTAGLFRLAAQEDPGCFAGLRQVWTGGDVVPAAAVRRVLEACPGLVVVDGYGPTETTTFTSARAFDAAGAVPDALPIGRPLDGMRVLLLDAALRPVPRGAVGELYVAGPGVARGYLGRPDLTAERFVADPSGEPGARMYRTGDRARITGGGELEFHGRADGQVKLRGFRVEPGETEARLTALPGVGQAAVVVREDRPGDRRLVGYAVPASGVLLDGPALRERLAGELPEYLVPSAVVVLDRLPLTANGKLDRAALPEPARGLPQATSSRGPATPREEVVCGLYAEVLGLPAAGPEDDFFDLGGDSLLAMRLVARLRAVFGAEVGVREVFGARTPAALAALVADTEPGHSRSDVKPGIPKATADDRLSVAQQRLWFLHRLEGAGAAYNIPLAVRFTGGPLDTEALRAALGDLVGRHESLRTVYPDVAGVPHRRLAEQTPQPVVEEITEAELPGALAREAGRGFDLASELPLRACVFVLGPEDHVLLLVLHHIAADGWSLRPLVRDLSAAYRARASGDVPAWTPLPVSYADYASWHRHLLGDPADTDSLLARQLVFWREALAGLPDELPLPADHKRPARPTHLGGDIPFALPAALHQRLRVLAARHGGTVFMVLQAGLAALLTRLGAGTDIPVGTPVAGRSDEALDDLVGFFVNTLVLRTDTSGDPDFRTLLERVRGSALAAYAHQDLPFERLVEALNPPRSLARHPLFQVMLTLRPPGGTPWDLPGLRAAELTVGSGATKVDLSLNVAERTAGDGAPAGIEGVLQYSADLFEPEAARELADRLARLLAAAAENPDAPLSALEVLDAAERHRLLVTCNDTARPVPDIAFHELFAARATETPQAPAVADGRVELTYGELKERADRLACVLRDHGVGRGGIVAFALPRSVDIAVAVLGVLTAGAAYLPLDPGHPAERTARLLTDAAPGLLLTTGAADDRLPADPGCPVLDLGALDMAGGGTEPVPVSGSDAAYVIFTSGTTGRPKGVVVEHRNLTNYVLRCVEAYPGLRGRTLLHATMSFDATVTVLHGALAAGGTVHIAELHEAGAAPLPGGYTFLKATPSHLTLLPGLPYDVSPGEELMLGGEALVGEAVRDWRDRHPGVRLFNHYGPTELTVGCTDLRFEPGERVPSGPVPIGRPMWNTRAYVLDERLRPVPPGVPGELYVAGAQVTRGYLGRPGLTAERFVADPYGTLFGEPGARMYRTGDRAVRRRDGVLQLRGRADRQLKIRGLRIEPGEIEAVLAGHPDVGQAVVGVHDGPTGPLLAGYLVPADGRRPGPEDIRAHAARLLPAHMVPQALLLLDTLPLTPNGKLDRDALPAPAVAPERTTAGRAPSGEREEVLCRLVAEVLGLDRVGPDEGFFRLGGDSILSIQLVSRALAAGLRITPRDVFEQQTAAGLAAVASGTDALQAPSDPGDGFGEVPLTPAMHRLRERGGPIGPFSQTVLLRTPAGADERRLAAALLALLDHHDALRLRLTESAGDWFAEIPPPGSAKLALERADITNLAPAAAESLIGEHVRAQPGLLNPARGELVRAVWFDAGAETEGRLLLTVHHLAVDGVSWRILAADLADAWKAEGEPRFAPVAMSFRGWARLLRRESAEPRRAAEAERWRDMLGGSPSLPGVAPLDPSRDTVGGIRHLSREVPAGDLLTAVPAHFNTGAEEVLLTALALAFACWRAGRDGVPGLLVDVERHGREELSEGADPARTVGWFTSVAPHRLDLAGQDADEALRGGAGTGQALKQVKEQVRALPDRGIGHGLLRHLNPGTRAALADLPTPQVGFNYLGRLGTPGEETPAFGLVPHPALGPLGLLGAARDPAAPVPHGLEVTVLARGPVLGSTWSWAPGVWDERDVRELADLWCRAAEALAAPATRQDAGGHTPSDLPLVSLSQEEIDELEAEFASEWR
ncbi:amino acid adenylation domain-containing protein [Streptomyces sp. NPDC057002]|uniref:amino acid adenylation domain-containing protein n=1 Tax=Streptomyces sp. NPDC057002 TaxID=3345992 RepID=UPI00362AA293